MYMKGKRLGAEYQECGEEGTKRRDRKNGKGEVIWEEGERGDQAGKRGDKNGKRRTKRLDRKKGLRREDGNWVVRQRMGQRRKAKLKGAKQVR
jgi:hypothetical protein